MKIRITQPILADHPGFLLGVLIVKGIDNSRQISAVQQLVSGVSAAKNKEFTKNPGRESVDLWHRIQPQKSRLEELCNDVLAQTVAPTGTPIEDFIDYYAIRHEMPIRAEDLDEVCGDIELAYSEGTEPFRSKGNTKIERPNSGEIIYKDKAGVTCRFFNTLECERTALHPTTRNVVITTENIGFYSYEKMKEILKEMAATIQKYCKCNIEIHILGDRVSEVDLGVTGKTGMSEEDFKINQKRLEFHQRILERKAAKHSEKPKALKSMQLKKLEPEKISEEKGKSTEIPARKAAQTIKKAILIGEKIERLMKEAVKKTFTELTEIPEFTIEPTRESAHGDYACNVSMMLSKSLKKSPADIAKSLLENIEKPQYLEKVEFAPPGFINFFLNEKWLKEEVANIINGKIPYAPSKENRDRTIIVEYSSPNVAKPLGAHHLITTILGQTLYNIYHFLGYNVISINHIGDWGTQFGKLIVAYEKWGSKKDVEKNPIDELLALYVKFHEEFEKLEKEHSEKPQALKSPAAELESQARDIFKKLEKGDGEIRKLWKWIVEISMKDVEKTYKALGGIHFDHTQGESFYEDKMQEVIDTGIEKKILEIGEGGSLIAKFKDEKYPPMLVKKSDGATLYATRDLAQMTYRIKNWHPEKILYVVDVAQSLHFQQLIETMQKFGTHGTELVHVSFGRMNFADGKMSTRKGNIIKMNEVLEEAVQRAKKLMEQKDPGKKVDMRLAVAIGIGAIKYNILSQNRVTEILFDWDKMLSLEGNCSPYIQYTHARTQSILKKAEEELKKTKSATAVKKEKVQDSQVSLFEAIAASAPEEESVEVETVGVATPLSATEHEQNLTKKLIQFGEVLERVIVDYKPNLLCSYLYELCQEFNAFYHTVPVIKTAEKDLRDQRLQLVAATGVVIARSLDLLGIEAVEKM